MVNLWILDILLLIAVGVLDIEVGHILKGKP